jgi:CRP-like cAMP-binding protein
MSIEQGTFFGEMPVMGQRMHRAFAEAITECIVCPMRRDALEQLIARKPQVAMRILEALESSIGAALPATSSM